MGSEAAEAEKAAPEAHGSPSKDVVREQREEEAEQVTPAGEEKRGTKRESPEKEGDGAAEEGSMSKRPSRERKTVERYSAVSPRKLSATKSLKIVEGAGTKLRDIPNVVFKLSKRKADENLQALHTILFGRKSNTYFLKRNILQFSGFVWTENKEKHKAKVKEKLDKFIKDKLVDFCELLDINFPRTSTKKEDVSAMLLEFLESPHVTRELLLADKEKKGKKRRSRTKVSRETAEDASSDKEAKKHKKSSNVEVKKGRKHTTMVEDEDSSDSDGMKGASSGEENSNGLEEESDHDKLEEDDEENESEEPRARKKESDETEPKDGAEPEDKEMTSAVKKCSSIKSVKSPSKPVSKKATQPVEDEPDVAVDSKHVSTKEQTKKGSKATTKEKAVPVKKEDKKKSSRKNVSVDATDLGPAKSPKSNKEDGKKGQNKEKVMVKDKKARKKKEAKPVPKVVKEQGKGKKKAGPSAVELHSVVTDILKEVDFNTATLVDILKQLGAHFNVDLMDRKAEVKNIIEEVINNMTDDEDEDEDDDDEDNLGNNQEDKNTKEEESDRDSK